MYIAAETPCHLKVFSGVFWQQYPNFGHFVQLTRQCWSGSEMELTFKL